jgi:hypothetical protein
LRVMRMKMPAVIAAAFVVAGLVAVGTANQVAAQRTPPASPVAAAAGDVKSVLFNWQWYMGMLREVQEIDRVATLDVRKSTGTIRVAGQPCRLTDYRASINYQTPGMRAQYTCARPDGQSYKGIEVVSGQFAWDENQVGAGLVAGRGVATPNSAALNERLIRLWSGPQGAPKAAVAGGANTKVAVEGGKAVVSFPIPGVAGAMAKATLNADNRAERVEVRHGTSVTEFTYANYADRNPREDRVEAFFPGSIVEKRDGVTILELTVGETQVGNPYVVVPVPENVRKPPASQR